MKETLERLDEVVAEFAATSLCTLPEHELLDGLDRGFARVQTLYAVLMRIVREAEGRGVPGRQHAATANAWLRQRLRISAIEAGRMLHGGRLLDGEPVLDKAMDAGLINTEQLGVIGKALHDLPTNVEPQVRADAVTALAGFAGTLEPAALRAVGNRILDHVAPELADEINERRLRDMEREAHERRFFTMVPTGDGAVRVHGLLTAESAATITAALDPLCAPAAAQREMAESGAVRTPGQRRADALLDVFRIALSGGALPEAGGDRPQLAVTVPYDVLRHELGAGRLDSGDTVSAATVRRLACDARILPLVLGSQSQVLDAGRTQRLATGAVRRAVVQRDRGCTFPGCDRPARWCDAHHIVSWAAGGPTDLDNLALLCGYHHGLLHGGSGWRARIGSDGHPEYLPPAWIDPQQIPRRNTYHHRE